MVSIQAIIRSRESYVRNIRSYWTSIIEVMLRILFKSLSELLYDSDVFGNRNKYKKWPLKFCWKFRNWCLFQHFRCISGDFKRNKFQFQKFTLEFSCGNLELSSALGDLILIIMIKKFVTYPNNRWTWNCWTWRLWT